MQSLPKIKSVSGSLSQNPERISETFHSFFSKLYSKEHSNDLYKLETFLEEIPLPKLKVNYRSILESHIMETEVRGVIKDVWNGSFPGPDGFSTCYYKTFVNALSPYLVRLFSSLRSGQPLDSASNLAYISMIPEPGKTQWSRKL